MFCSWCVDSVVSWSKETENKEEETGNDEGVDDRGIDGALLDLWTSVLKLARDWGYFLNIPNLKTDQRSDPGTHLPNSVGSDV